jgi:hypothetical protein
MSFLYVYICIYIHLSGSHKAGGVLRGDCAAQHLSTIALFGKIRQPLSFPLILFMEHAIIRCQYAQFGGRIVFQRNKNTYLIISIIRVVDRDLTLDCMYPSPKIFIVNLYQDIGRRSIMSWQDQTTRGRKHKMLVYITSR